MYKLCHLAKKNIKMGNIDIAHRTKNGSIIVKFSERPSRDKLFHQDELLTKIINLKRINNHRLRTEWG